MPKHLRWFCNKIFLNLHGDRDFITFTAMVKSFRLRILFIAFMTIMVLFKEWELLVLKTLQWDISVATAYDFVEQILTRLTLPRDQQKKIQNCLDAYIDFSATGL